jgi:predicted RNase H-related nuclease YkuK (DUF458 family)
VDNGSTANSNKVYIMEEQADGQIKCEYGRVGKSLVTEMKPAHKWTSVYKQKTSAAKGYTDVTELLVESVAQVSVNTDSKVEAIKDAVVKKLVEELMAFANKSIQQNYKVTQEAVSEQQVNAAQEVIDKIRSYIESNKGSDFELIVGTDSQCHHGMKSIKYVTAIVIRKVGNGAQYFYRQEYQNGIPSIRKKIWNEALLTYGILEKVKELTSDVINKDKVIPHVDVGHNGKTKKYINEITSIFLNSGYDVKIKPNRYVASGVADKHSK